MWKFPACIFIDARCVDDGKEVKGADDDPFAWDLARWWVANTTSATRSISWYLQPDKIKH